MTTRPKSRLREMRAALLQDPKVAVETQSEGERRYAAGLARLLLEQDFAGAGEAFRAARAAFGAASERVECLLEEARVEALLGRPASAAEALRLAIAEAGDEPVSRAEASAQLARLLARRGDFAGALEAHLDAHADLDRQPPLEQADVYGFEAWLREQLGDFRGWAEAVRRLVAASPDKLALFHMPADDARTRRRCDRLLRGLEAAAAESEGCEARWLEACRALVLTLARRTEAAEGVLAPLCAEPHPAFVDHLAGKCALKLDRPEEARRRFEAAAAAGPLSFDLQLDLAMCAEVLGDYPEALRGYEAVRALAPEQLFPVARSAILNESLNNKVAAVEAYEVMRARDPANRAALVRLALLNVELERHEDARVWLDRALEAVGPDPTLLVARAGAARALGDPEAALADVLGALALLEPLLEQAQARVHAPGAEDAPPPAGDPEARRSTRRLTAGTARRLAARAQLALAGLYKEAGRLDEAGEALERALEELPESEEGLLLRGDLARMKGAPRDAVDSYKQLIDKVVGESLLRDGQALSLAGRYGEALIKFKAAFERFPQNWALYYNTAQAYAQLGELGAAVKVLAIACEINRDVPDLVEDEPGFAALRQCAAWRAFVGGDGASGV